MKRVFFFILIGISLPALLTAQIKPGLKVKPQKECVQTNETNPKIKVFNIKENPGKISEYKAPSVVSLKQMSTKLPGYDAKIAQVEKNKIDIPNPYNNENGVVLSALNPRENFTGSNITLNGVTFNPQLIENIESGVIPRVQLTAPAGPYAFLHAEFKGLPSSNHLFLLTIAAATFLCF